MTPTPAEMLRALGSGVRPAGLDAAPSRKGSIESSGFADLLSAARAGEVSSHRPVTVEKGAGVELSQEQLEQLAAAADKAEAAGIRKALVMLGDKQFVLDVQTRSVVGAADLSQGCLAGIDGAIRLGPDATGPGPGILPLPRTDPSTLASLGLKPGSRAA